MSGAAADLRMLLGELGEEDVLIVDEAHALGLRGEHGAGVASAYDDARIVVLGTLSKAFGCLGGFVAGPTDFIDLLVSTARSFIFDTSLPPPIVRAARAALRRIVEGDDLRAMLAERIGHAAAALARLGLVDGVPGSPIVPIVLGETRRALAVAAHLRSRGLYAPAIRPPTVPAGTSRLRVTIRTDHQFSDIDRLADALAEALVGASA
jgi:7-keto-8-aminopelargonate synthetase-like enzyme